LKLLHFFYFHHVKITSIQAKRAFK
jgi:hypothetical protein